MEEIINKLLGIDNKAKSVISEYESKMSNLDYYISEEISKRKKEIDSKYKFRIDFEKNEYNRKLKEKKSIMQEIKDKGIEELRTQYQKEKENLTKELVNSIISKGE